MLYIEDCNSKLLLFSCACFLPVQSDIEPLYETYEVNESTSQQALKTCYLLPRKKTIQHFDWQIFQCRWINLESSAASPLNSHMSFLQKSLLCKLDIVIHVVSYVDMILHIPITTTHDVDLYSYEIQVKRVWYRRENMSFKMHKSEVLPQVTLKPNLLSRNGPKKSLTRLVLS